MMDVVVPYFPVAPNTARADAILLVNHCVNVVSTATVDLKIEVKVSSTQTCSNMRNHEQILTTFAPISC